MTDGVSPPRIEPRARAPIAVVGIGCRYPGGIVDAASFWRVVAGGVDTITDIPADRFDLARWYDARPGMPGRIGSRKGGFVGPVDRFDAYLFGISPREAERLDPQQRLLLEVAWEAFLDAGMDPSGQEGSRCGVYVGQWVGEYESRLFADPTTIDFHSTQGTGRYASSGRLSYTFGLCGPSVTLDTACSSSLVATHLAINSLRSGETNAALVGGVNLILQPHTTIAYSRGRMMASDGHSKFGDASANGYVRAEGAAVLLLKRLDDAERDGDRVYAVLHGSAINNDGRSSGLFGRPSRSGQVSLLVDAYRDAGVPAQQLSFVEAHGTGTRAGDPVELDALAEVVGRERSAPLWVGSIKTNIGHTEAAAGLAGLIKASLSLYHGVVPPSLHFREPTSSFDWSASSLQVPTAAVTLEGDRDRWLGGVTSFGISGTNAHVVVGTGPQRAPVPVRSAGLLLPLAAHIPAALGQYAKALADRFEHATAAEVARTAAVLARRSSLPHRAAIVGGDVAAVVAGLRALADGEPAAGLVTGEAPIEGRHRTALVFPGQGGQWLGMGRRLLETEPVFAQTVAAIDEVLAPLVDWSVTEQLQLDPADPTWQLDRIDVIQPVLVALEMAYAALLRDYGIRADGVVGHSMGEVGAAWYVGALSLADAMTVIVHRSRLLRTVAGAGAMAVVELGDADARAAIGARTDRVGVAVRNASNSSVLSGDPDAVGEIIAELEARGVFTRYVKVDVASHSPQMDALTGPLVDALGAIVPGATAIAMYSTVLAEPLAGSGTTAAYWGQNLREPVRFAETIDRMLADGYDTFIEVGPHPVLTSAVTRVAEDRGAEVRVLSTGRRDEDAQLEFLNLLGECHVAGLPVDWHRVYPGPIDHDLELPPFPMVRERYWFDPGLEAVTEGGATGHPLLVAPFAAAVGVRGWEASAQRIGTTWLADHVVRQSVLWPAAASAEGLLAAVSDAAGGNWFLRNVRLHEALPVEPARPVRLQWSERGDAKGRHVSLHAREGGDESGWRLIADATAIPRVSDRQAVAIDAPHAADLVESGEDFYRRLRLRGLEYGPAFQTITEVRSGKDNAESRLALPQPVLTDPGLERYRVHPVLIDAALQTIIAAAVGPDNSRVTTPLPVRIGTFEVGSASWQSGPLAVRASVTDRSPGGFTGNAVVSDSEGRLIATLESAGFAWTGVETGTIDETFFSLDWEPVELVNAEVEGRRFVVIGDREASLAGSLRARGGQVDAVSSLDALTALGDLPGACDVIWCVDGEGSSQDQVMRGEQLVTQAVRLGQWCTERDSQVARVVVVTRGAVGFGGDGACDVAVAATRAVGRVLGHEVPGLLVQAVDLPVDGSWGEALPASIAASADAELAYRDGRWYAARLGSFAVPEARVGVDESYQLTLLSPGSPDQLEWVARGRRAPGAGMVEVEVEAVGLNFMNALSVLGAYPGAPNGVGSLGLEGAGRVSRVGEGISHVAPGDRVLFVAPDAMARHVVTSGELVVPAPTTDPAEVLAALPIAYLTVHYGLGVLARLCRGDRVLIHSAAGGVGLAAIAYARMCGAEVYATAGTAEKREWLKSLGVHHVFDSRSLAWADAVLEATGGEGVDVVLNSLAGQAQERGLDVLRTDGRFVEIGKRDIYDDRALSLGAFRNGLAFFAVDLDRMIRERPDRVGAMLRDVSVMIGAGQLELLPVETFPADQVGDAFRRMLPGTHRGKLVVSLAVAPSRLALGPAVAPIRDHGTYLVTGGLGALGLVVASWLVERGAGAIVLVGRRAPDQATKAKLDELARRGTRIETRAFDIGDRDAVTSLFASLSGLPALRGVFHLAGTLDDAPISALTPERIAVPYRPKAAGGLHVLDAARAHPLDFAVAFSSVASRFGTPGQANYAAANAVLDARAANTEARLLSINFGPFASIGLAAADPARLSALARQGFGALDGEEALLALDRLLGAGVRGAVTVARFDAERWVSGKDDADRRWVARLLDGRTDEPAQPVMVSWRGQVEAIPPGRPRRRELERLVTAEAAAALRLPPAQIGVDRPLRTLGMDSLLTLEFRKRLERATDLRVGAPVFFSHPTVAALTSYLAERWELPLDAAAVADDSELETLLDDLSALSEEELDALLGDGGGA